MSLPKKARLKCPECNKYTWCMVFAEERRDAPTWEEPGQYVENLFAECQGCETFFIVKEVYNSECDQLDDGTILPAETITIPAPISIQCRINDFFDLGDRDVALFVEELFPQIASSICHKNYIVAAAGMRSLIDCFCIAKTGEDKGIDANLEMLVEKGYITQRQGDLFEKILNIGHGAVHRFHAPKKRPLESAFKAIESLYETLFVLPQLEWDISKEKVPPKKKRTRKKSNESSVTVDPKTAESP